MKTRAILFITKWDQLNDFQVIGMISIYRYINEVLNKCYILGYFTMSVTLYHICPPRIENPYSIFKRWL